MAKLARSLGGSSNQAWDEHTFDVGDDGAERHKSSGASVHSYFLCVATQSTANCFSRSFARPSAAASSPAFC